VSEGGHGEGEEGEGGHDRDPGGYHAFAATAREEKANVRWFRMLENKEVKIGLLKTNVATKKREEHLALLTAETSTMDAESRAWCNEQRAVIFHEMAPVTATSTTPTARSTPPTTATSTTVTTTEEAPSIVADPTAGI
jgi:hypothetical protein